MSPHRITADHPYRQLLDVSEDGYALEQSSLAKLKPTDTKSSSRGFFIELLIDLVVFVICTLVCLQVIAIAQLRLEDSSAIAKLGQSSVNLAENWKSGADLEGLQDKFGGQLTGGQLTLGYDRQFQPTEADEAAWYRIVFTPEERGSGYATAKLQLIQGDKTLIDWSVGRYLASREEP